MHRIGIALRSVGCGRKRFAEIVWCIFRRRLTSVTLGPQREPLTLLSSTTAGTLRFAMASTFRYCRQCLRPLRRAAIQSPARSYSSATFSAARHGEDVLITTVKRVPLARPFSRATSPIFSQTTQRATLTSSAHRPRAIINPRKDDEGNDMDIEITQRAASVSRPRTSSRHPDAV